MPRRGSFLQHHARIQGSFLPAALQGLLSLVYLHLSTSILLPLSLHHASPFARHSSLPRCAILLISLPLQVSGENGFDRAPQMNASEMAEYGSTGLLGAGQPGDAHRGWAQQSITGPTTLASTACKSVVPAQRTLCAPAHLGLARAAARLLSTSPDRRRTHLTRTCCVLLHRRRLESRVQYDPESRFPASHGALAGNAFQHGGRVHVPAPGISVVWTLLLLPLWYSRYNL